MEPQPPGGWGGRGDSGRSEREASRLVKPPCDGPRGSTNPECTPACTHHRAPCSKSTKPQQQRDNLESPEVEARDTETKRGPAGGVRSPGSGKHRHQAALATLHPEEHLSREGEDSAGVTKLRPHPRPPTMAGNADRPQTRRRKRQWTHGPEEEGTPGARHQAGRHSISQRPPLFKQTAPICVAYLVKYMRGTA